MIAEQGDIRQNQIKNILDGNEIILHKVNLKNMQQLFQELQSPEVLNNLSLDIENLSDFRRYLIYLNQQWNYFHNFSFIINLSSGDPIGMATLFDLNFTHLRAEIGIWVGISYQRKGYAKKTLRMLIKYAFNDLHLNRLEAHIFPENEASINLFTQMGFKVEGLRKEYVKKESGYIDVIAFSLLKSSIDKL